MSAPLWLSYVGAVTGVIGAITGIAGAVMGISFCLSQFEAQIQDLELRAA
jgi:hypothetical protein